MNKNTFLYKIARRSFDSFRIIAADFKIKKFKKVDNNGRKRKVVLISQMPNLWNNMRELYQKLLEEEEFEVYILMVPEFNYSESVFNMGSISTDIYDFHLNKKHQNIIKAFDNEQWFDLKDLAPDYVFFERPYTSYLPKDYQINQVCKYAITCYVSYGFEMMNYIFDVSLNVNFFRYLHIFFADSYVVEEYNKKRMPLSHKLGLRKTVLTGHPIFKAFNAAKNQDNVFWANNDKSFKVIWAPRWTIDTEIGGSNFLVYKDKILNFITADQYRSLVFRPHPLTFSNFISLGLISSEEVEEYLDKFKKNDQLYYDDTPDYFTTFWHSDVFVGDISSIIPCYFLTGKPIIYCHTGAVDDNDIMNKIISVSYNAYNFDDVAKYLDDLQKGIDPLKEERLNLINKLFNDDYVNNVINKMIQCLKDN